MEITIKRYSRKLTYEDATLDESKRTKRSLDQALALGRECDKYIIAAQSVLPYFATLEASLPAGDAG